MSEPAAPLGATLETPFVRRFFAAREDLVAARWWHEGMPTPMKLGWLAGGGLLGAIGNSAPEDSGRRAVIILFGGAFGVALLASRCDDEDDDTDTISRDALEVQRREGWNVAATNARLSFHGPSGLDVTGKPDWQQHVGELPAVLQPTQEALRRHAVPTLFDVLGSPSFRNVVMPVSTPEMDLAFSRGQAMAALFRDPAAPGHAAIVVDAAGPEAVAFAAGLADAFEPVFLFDNWPHPDGVVPSHEAIGAALYYQPVFAAERGARAATAPPAFVLDRWRLNPYVDAPDKFDNRYLARLPSAGALAALGLHRLLYVTDASTLQESDDLNDDFVALDQAGIPVQLVSMADFRAPDPGQPRVVSYGGAPHSHVWFWHSYSARSVPLPRTAPPTRLSQGAAYRPAPRATIFSSRLVGGSMGVGRQKPTGFGRVSMQAARGTGRVVGRTGSFGRGGWHGG